jgi:hypothetical protein
MCLLRLNASERMHMRLGTIKSVYLRCYTPSRPTIGLLPIIKLYQVLFERLKKEERPELVLMILRGLCDCSYQFPSIRPSLALFCMSPVCRNRRILFEVDRSDLITMLCRYLDNRVLGITRSSFVRILSS